MDKNKGEGNDEERADDETTKMVVAAIEEFNNDPSSKRSPGTELVPSAHEF